MGQSGKSLRESFAKISTSLNLDDTSDFINDVLLRDSTLDIDNNRKSNLWHSNIQTKKYTSDLLSLIF